jgi:hypothetical protein
MSRKAIAKNNVSKANITHVHLTGSPAVPDATFVILKSLDEATTPAGFEDIETTILFKSVDTVKKQVFGYCLVPDTPDLQGDVFSKTIVEDACHSLMANLAGGVADGEGSGVDHKIFKGGVPIESCIDADGSIAKAHGAQGIPGGWWLGVQVTDDGVWSRIEKGDIKGFTVGGKGKREPIAKANADVDTAAERSILKRVGDFLSNLTKGDGDAESYDERIAEEELRSKLWKKIYSLEDALLSIVGDDTVTDKVTAIGQSIGQFQTDFIATLQAAETAKANANTNNIGVQKTHTTEGDSTMTPEQLQQLTQTMETLNKSVNDLTTALAAKPPVEPPEGASGKLDGDLSKGGADEADPELVKTVETLEKTVKEIQTKLEKISRTPQTRRGTSEPGSTNKGAGEEDTLAKSAEGTAFDFALPK